MRNFMTISWIAIAKAVPRAKVNNDSIQGICNAYILLLVARGLSELEIIQATGFSSFMVSSCFSTMDSDARGRINNILYSSLFLLTNEELKSLRSEMRADGEWMRVRLLHLSANSPKPRPNPRQG